MDYILEAQFDSDILMEQAMFEASIDCDMVDTMMMFESETSSKSMIQTFKQKIIALIEWIKKFVKNIIDTTTNFVKDMFRSASYKESRKLLKNKFKTAQEQLTTLEKTGKAVLYKNGKKIAVKDIRKILAIQLKMAEDIQRAIHDYMTKDFKSVEEVNKAGQAIEKIKDKYMSQLDDDDSLTALLSAIEAYSYSEKEEAQMEKNINLITESINDMARAIESDVEDAADKLFDEFDVFSEVDLPYIPAKQEEHQKKNIILQTKAKFAAAMNNEYLREAKAIIKEINNSPMATIIQITAVLGAVLNTKMGGDKKLTAAMAVVGATGAKKYSDMTKEMVDRRKNKRDSIKNIEKSKDDLKKQIKDLKKELRDTPISDSTRRESIRETIAGLEKDIQNLRYDKYNTEIGM